jgi:hypothetical protein
MYVYLCTYVRMYVYIYICIHVPGREYVLEMQRQAAGKGYHRRSAPFSAFAGGERHGVSNVLDEGGRDWLLLDGCAGELLVDLGRPRCLVALALTNPLESGDRATRGFRVDVSSDILNWQCRIQGNMTSLHHMIKTKGATPQKHVEKREPRGSSADKARTGADKARIGAETPVTDEKKHEAATHFSKNEMAIDTHVIDTHVSFSSAQLFALGEVRAR